MIVKGQMQTNCSSEAWNSVFIVFYLYVEKKYFPSSTHKSNKKCQQTDIWARCMFEWKNTCVHWQRKDQSFLQEKYSIPKKQSITHRRLVEKKPLLSKTFSLKNLFLVVLLSSWPIFSSSLHKSRNHLRFILYRIIWFISLTCTQVRYEKKK